MPQTKGFANSVSVDVGVFERVTADTCPPPIRDLLQSLFFYQRRCHKQTDLLIVSQLVRCSPRDIAARYTCSPTTCRDILRGQLIKVGTTNTKESANSLAVGVVFSERVTSSHACPPLTRNIPRRQFVSVRNKRIGCFWSQLVRSPPTE